MSAIGLTSAAWLAHRHANVATDDPLADAATVTTAAPEQDAASQAAASAAPASESASAYRVETAVVGHSFSEAAQRLGVDAATTARLARAFSGRLDFRRDLQRGSEIRFVFRNDTSGANGASEAKDANDVGAANAGAPQNTVSSDDTPVAIRISNGNVSHDLFLYRNLAGKAFYYSADGHAAAPSFLRYPVKFTRVSSHFSLRRLDPVTHRVQPHEGVDLAAPVGTPVQATARGTVTFAGWQTGYGKVVKLENFGPYSTTFAHLSRFAKHLKVGQTVSKGQVIGYVGATGWATGPHLHYEVHVDQVAQDPLTVDLPHRDPLQGEDKQRFAQQVALIDPLL
ncbi:peptidoglycan DD-metalloendopeptidase family protein [Paraburkholderia sp. CNPSo 3076]|uniref:M23 family metallopeptidase n=1 Tax=Paraburkholderia sp. CNPSo 3076 TaxID=2940936 RepID=UPI00225A3CBF|nr:peptidoglycan DD-metalloendopeptidase family protein [Paraburkholderia sp. CNPSo 3076]MCX5540790.1 peptidoglycan DD-metalloendopeptidase family protein [Paraburkholderia sp. CNPSo 3076]